MGTTRALGPSSCRRRNHPRSCGDHAVPTRRVPGGPGSSPLVRGPLYQTREHQNALGVIPARAGTTLQSAVWDGHSRGHPRSCGDHVSPRISRHMKWGSSPLVRGPRVAGAVGVCGLGVIPARAGTTRRLQDRRGAGGGHPRSCGDHSGSRHPIRRGQGSSPLVRGPHSLVMRIGMVRGVIPARAGTTAGNGTEVWDRRGHPRSCGDHT